MHTATPHRLPVEDTQVELPAIVRQAARLLLAAARRIGGGGNGAAPRRLDDAAG